MKLGKVPLAVLILLVLVALAPAASACIQVYPWSELCSGDVEGFLRAWLP